jgi:hypothetical protein
MSLLYSELRKAQVALSKYADLVLPSVADRAQIRFTEGAFYERCRHYRAAF